MKTLKIKFNPTHCRQLLYFILIILSSSSKSQVLLTEISNENDILQDHQEEFRDTLLASGYYSEHMLVEIGGIPAIQDSGRLSFTIPGRSTNYTAIGDIVNFIDEDNYSWTGNIQDQYPGEILIVYEDKAVAGYIQLAEEFYTLYPAGDNNAMMFKNDLEEWNELECEADSNPPLDAELPNPCEEPENCHTITDVLILISEPAALYLNQLGLQTPYGYLELKHAHLRSAFESVNAALKRSGINNQSFRFSIEPDPFEFEFHSSNNIDFDALNLSLDSGAQSLRNEYKADIVVMLTNENYGDAAGTSRKILAESDSAYCIVEVPYLVGPRWTLAHEIAHLYGARHDRGENGDDTDICNHGFIFEAPNFKLYRTIMATTYALLPTDCCGRLNQFSNPKIEYNNLATGDEDNNNAIAIQNLNCVFEDYRSDPYWSIDMITPQAVCVDEYNEVCAIINNSATGFPGIGPYTYEWRYNFSGIFSIANPGTYFGNNSCEDLFIDGPINAKYVFVKLKITSYDEQQLSWVESIKIKNDDCDVPPYQEVPNTPQSNISSFDRSILNSGNVKDKNIFSIDPDNINIYANIQLLDYTGKLYFNCSHCTIHDLDDQISSISEKLPILLIYSLQSENGIKTFLHINAK